MTTPVDNNSAVDPYAILNGTKGQTQDAKSNQQLGQNEFLKLMLAQMKNQDPMKPTDPTTFLSQLAQFTQVTGIQNMQTSMADLASSLRSTQVLSGTSLVGHDVLAPATKDTIAAGEVVHGAVDAPDGASTLQITVKDSSGALVRSFTVPATSGLNEFTWDGLNGAGTPAPAGEYTFGVSASVAGKAQALDPLLSSKVASVTIDPKTGSLTLNTSTGAVAIGDVRRVL
jgi:flagellar basal-body rod modification protein FlgD